LRPIAVPPVAETSKASGFGALFDQEFSYVWTTLRRLGVHERDLEDMAHEVFLQVHRHWESYDAGRPARPWLFGFAYRMAADYRRLARHRVALVGDVTALDTAVAAAPSADEALAERETIAFVLRALERIDFDQRAVLVLHDMDQCPMKEVASALSIPVNTAYSRLRLARARFALVVRRMQLTEGWTP
jgi:RNA polymerase sigma-70 factor (ECF subfamily)